MSYSMKGARRIEIDGGEVRKNWSYFQKRAPLRAATEYTPRRQWGQQDCRGQGHLRDMVTRGSFLPHRPRLACLLSVYFVTCVGGFSVSSESIATVNTVIFLRNFTRFCVRWSAPVQETKAVVSHCLPLGVNQSSCVQIHILLEEMSWLCPLRVLTFCWCLKNFILEIQEQGGGYRRVVFVFVYSS